MFKLFSSQVTVVFLSILLSFTLVSCSQTEESSVDTLAVSSTVNINQGWLFKRLELVQSSASTSTSTLNSDSNSNSSASNELTQEKWQLVNLPHTPKIEPLIVNEQWQGTSWYQKQLTIDSKWKKNKIFIRFEGAMSHAEMWLNDKKIAEHLGGYLPFTIDLTELVSFNSENILKVKLKNIDIRLEGLISKLDRQFLHAKTLGFIHPRTSEEMVFSSILPQELDNLLKMLRNTNE